MGSPAGRSTLASQSASMLPLVPLAGVPLLGLNLLNSEPWRPDPERTESSPESWPDRLGRQAASSRCELSCSSSDCTGANPVSWAGKADADGSCCGVSLAARPAVPGLCVACASAASAAGLLPGHSLLRSGSSWALLGRAAMAARAAARACRAADDRRLGVGP